MRWFVTGQRLHRQLEAARGSLLSWLEHRGGTIDDYAFPRRVAHSAHLSMRASTLAPSMNGWGNWPSQGGLRHPFASADGGMDHLQGNLRAVLILLVHTKSESTVRYLGVDVEDALAVAESTEV
jgi:hypothetical protein